MKKQSALSHITYLMLISTITCVYNLQSMLVSPYDSIHVSPNVSRETVEKKRIAQNNLMRAISSNNIMAVQQAIQEKPDLNTPHPFCHETPLERAIVTHAKPEIIALLVNNNASVNTRISPHINENNVTPLMLAAQKCPATVIQILTDANADLDATDNNGQTVWHYANQEVREVLSRAIESRKEKMPQGEINKAIQRLQRIIQGIRQQSENEIKAAEQAIEILNNSKNRVTATPVSPARVRYYRGMDWVDLDKKVK